MLYFQIRLTFNEKGNFTENCRIYKGGAKNNRTLSDLGGNIFLPSFKDKMKMIV